MRWGWIGLRRAPDHYSDDSLHHPQPPSPKIIRSGFYWQSKLHQQFQQASAISSQPLIPVPRAHLSSVHIIFLLINCTLLIHHIHSSRPLQSLPVLSHPRPALVWLVPFSAPHSCPPTPRRPPLSGSSTGLSFGSCMPSTTGSSLQSCWRSGAFVLDNRSASPNHSGCSGFSDSSTPRLSSSHTPSHVRNRRGRCRGRKVPAGALEALLTCTNAALCR